MSDPELRLAFLALYRAVGLMREETYRRELDPRRCLNNVENIGTLAQLKARDLFWKIREEMPDGTLDEPKRT